MTLQPKSSNLPEMQPKTDAALTSPGFIQSIVPGSENAIKEFNENLKTQGAGVLQKNIAEDKKQTQPDDRDLGPRIEQPQPMQQQEQARPQQQQQKPSRTDNCNCPEIIEEKVKPVNPEDADKPRKIVRYQRGRFLGKGGFAKCYEVRRLEPIETEEHQTKSWALKVVPKANLTRTKARQKLTSEIKIHRSLNNEYVVRFDRYFEDKENVYIMLDICQNQSLSDLVKRRKRLHEVEARYYIYQLVKAMEYIHAHKVIHRDLKLGNLFLTDRMGLKVGDFGLAAQVFYNGERKRTVCGTPNYLAPEVLDTGDGHSYEVDFWSIGVILYTMLHGRPPFESQEVKQTYKKIKAGAFQFPDHVQTCSYSKDFIKKCLVVDPQKRMNLAEMLQHDFLALIPIPKQIPVSTLVCPPATAFAKQYTLPARSSMTTVSPSPMGSQNLRQQRMLHHMQTAPMENVLRQVRTQKSLKSNENTAQQQKEGEPREKLYSPLMTNRNNSQCENGQIMASDPNGKSTPNTNGIGGGCHVFTRQISSGPVLCSEFNPLSEPVTTAKQDEQVANAAQKLDPNVIKQVLVDNYLQSQNKFGQTKEGIAEQLQGNSPQSKKQVPSIQNGLSKKNRNAKSGNVGFGATNMGNSTSPLKVQHQKSESVAQVNKGEAHGPTELHRLSSGETAASGKNIKSRVSMVKSVSANDKGQEDELKNLNQISANNKKQDAQSSELAKIQPTSASRIPHELLVTESETQQSTSIESCLSEMRFQIVNRHLIAKNQVTFSSLGGCATVPPWTSSCYSAQGTWRACPPQSWHVSPLFLSLFALYQTGASLWPLDQCARLYGLQWSSYSTAQLRMSGQRRQRTPQRQIQLMSDSCQGFSSPCPPIFPSSARTQQPRRRRGILWRKSTRPP